MRKYSEVFFKQKELTRDDVTYRLYAPYCNVNNKYIIEYKVPKVDVLDESTPETVSVLIQLLDTNPYDYKILNVYYRMRNYKAERYVSRYRNLLNKIVPILFAQSGFTPVYIVPIHNNIYFERK